MSFVPERNRTNFQERRVAHKSYLRFKAGLTATGDLETRIDAGLSNHRGDRTTLSRRRGFEHRSGIISWDGFSLELHRVHNLRHNIPSFCPTSNFHRHACTYMPPLQHMISPVMKLESSLTRKSARSAIS